MNLITLKTSLLAAIDSAFDAAMVEQSEQSISSDATWKHKHPREWYYGRWNWNEMPSHYVVNETGVFIFCPGDDAPQPSRCSFEDRITECDNEHLFRCDITGARVPERAEDAEDAKPGEGWMKLAKDTFKASIGNNIELKMTNIALALDAAREAGRKEAIGGGAEAMHDRSPLGASGPNTPNKDRMAFAPSPEADRGREIAEKALCELRNAAGGLLTAIRKHQAGRSIRIPEFESAGARLSLALAAINAELAKASRGITERPTGLDSRTAFQVWRKGFHCPDITNEQEIAWLAWQASSDFIFGKGTR